MKRTLQKPIALLLALIMALGAMPAAGIGMLTFAADPVLENVAIDPAAVTLTELGATFSLTLKPIWKNDVSGEFLSKDITWRSSNTEYLTIEASSTTPTAVITVEKLPAKIDESTVVTVTAQYLNVQGVFKTATAKITITRTNDDFNILKSIKFDPDTALMKTIGETLDLKINWNWNPDISSGSKFPLWPDDITFESSNTKYVTVEKAKPEGSYGGNSNVVFTEDQAVVTLKVMELPANVGDSVDVTITAKYANSKKVIKKATATITVMHFDEEIVLKGIEVTPDKYTMKKVAESVQLTANPVWRNGKPGIFNAGEVVWSLLNNSDSSFVSVTDKGVVTVRALPTVGQTRNIIVQASYIYGSEPEPFKAYAQITLVNISPVKKLESISVAPDAFTMKDVGDKQQLYVTATYSEEVEGGNPIITSMLVSAGVAYVSSDESLIRVSSTGMMEVVGTPAPNAAQDAVVTVKAYFEDKTAQCIVTIPRRHIYVNRINLDWNATAVVTELLYDYEDVFRYTTYLTETPPAGMEVDRNVTLTCVPADAVTLDPVNKTLLFRPISGTTQSVTLTLTADNASADCKPVSFAVTVYNDVPLEKVLWDYPVGSTGITGFAYYDTETTGVKQILGHYYEKTTGNITTYTYHTVPEYARGICSFKVTVSDPRVLRVDEKTHCLIPIGNGDTKLTITAKTPKGVTRSHTIIVRVSDSPYNPIAKAAIDIDLKTVPEGVSYTSSSNKLDMLYNQSFTLVAKLTALMASKTAKLDQDDIYFTTLDGRKLRIVDSIEYSWSSSNPDVVKIDSKTGEVTAVGAGDAVITLKIEDNGVEFKEQINVHVTMPWWAALVGLISSIILFRWSKIKPYFRALIEAIFG